ncbi:hypothetical protein V5O48_006647 [Marasmius crinis-equi]|uniref:Uncharacterized protein n=1 Tax=Marasmius crinis-equi TaxID=585013 RepID=A0ABR3FIY2_9AGAR
MCDPGTYYCRIPSSESPAILLAGREVLQQWDGSPQDHWHAYLTHDELDALDDLKVDWATHTNTGRQRNGHSRTASTAAHGYRSVRECFGILECDNPDCPRIIRPRSTKDGVQEQVFEWRLVLQWQNSQPRRDSSEASDDSELKELLDANPTAKLAALRGGNTVNGKSLLNVSNRFITEDVARREVNKHRSSQRRGETGNSWLKRFTKFREDHRGFVLASEFGDGVTIISVQTDFMASKLSKVCRNSSDFDGLVSDAAQKWFADRSSCLITTSVYSPDIQRWVPGIYSYANGETAIHYEYHFLALMRSIRAVKSLK